MNIERQVLSAAAVLVEYFSSGELEQYFNAFAPQATFIFYTHPQRLMSRDEYKRCWKKWEQEAGFRVLSCQSSNQTVQMLGDTALFMHNVVTHIHTNDGDQVVNERESILFRIDPDGRWLAWHEHLSPVL